MKRFPVRIIIITAAVLVILQAGVGVFLSPWAGRVIQSFLSGHTATKVTIEAARIWPVTLSVSVRGLKVFDPRNAQQRLLSAERISARLDPLDLLRKRIVVAAISVSTAVVILESTADSTFTIEKVAQKTSAPPGVQTRLQTRLQERSSRGDLWSRVYERVKNNGSIGRGNRQFVIRNFVGSGLRILVRDPDAHSIDIARADIHVRDASVDSSGGASAGAVEARGTLEKDARPAGAFEFSYRREPDGLSAALHAVDVDLAAVEFLFGDSLPVDIERGTLSITSRARVSNGRIESQHDLRLTDHAVAAKHAAEGSDFPVGAIIAAALNERNPFSVSFPLNGPLEKPDYGPCVQALLRQVKPSVSTIGAALSGILGEKAHEHPEALKAKEALESIFGT